MDYGFVDKIPAGLEKGDFYMIDHYYVGRTGSQQQFYTLYRDFSACLSGYWWSGSFRCVQNLSHDLDEAMAKAKKLARDGASIEYTESPQADHDRMKAFGLCWKKGPKAWYAEPDREFWALWKEDKDAIKAQGFWVSKNRNDGKFYVYLKHKGLTYGGKSIDELIKENGKKV